MKLINGDCLEIFKTIPNESIDCCITDCPYKIIAGGVRIIDEGDECSGVLSKRKDWSKTDPKGCLNIGRKMVSDGTDCSDKWLKKDGDIACAVKDGKMFAHNEIKFSDWLPELYRVMKNGSHTYIMVNSRNMYELQGECNKVGFKFQNQLIWVKGNCLGGNTQLLLKNNKGIIYRGNIKDLYRNFPKGTSILSENGRDWVNIKQVFKNSDNKVDVLNIITRGGSILKVTDEHLLYINGKQILAKDLKKGDNLDISHFILENKISFYDYNIGEIVGLYLADGNKDGTHGYKFNLNNTTKEKYFKKIINLCNKFNCTYNIFEKDCKKIITISGILGDIIKKFIYGDYAKDKKLNKDCYNQGLDFLRGLFDGFIGGDGNIEKTSKNSYRIRVCITYNKELENDLRIISNILGFQFKSKNFNAKIGDKIYSSIRITITNYTKHCNGKLDTEILEIKKHKSIVYDLEVESNSHKYCLASGIITHNCTPNKYYMQGYENVLMLRKGPAKNINNMGSSNIIKIPNIIGKKVHPTEKPVELMEILVGNSSLENEIVLDPFMGAGSTGLACKNLKRNFVGIEIDKEYFEIAKNRILNN